MFFDIFVLKAFKKFFGAPQEKKKEIKNSS